ncbi:diguanylate cyclase [Mangrovihabitans endophyticus]|uniref:Diguanylate cyclase (GGDEF) domain-containing protein n=1 Tax=Mangrovihabitans endophyticus TaxID=1751298 RepID=A0A8J3BYP1_9ACTN|nr:diguanylate cyclase [Mangrovihabitans endophyticus]GGK83718.1 hypothetical protein GCM10012284_17290 [Mangrovihabitans endophyticus]
MTLRGRLTSAFLAVVLGPVLLGALFVGITVTAVSRDRALDRLAHAATTVRTSMSAVCRQLQAVADAVATLPVDDRAAAAEQLTRRGLASDIRTDENGAQEITAEWRDCAAPADSGVVAIFARSGAGDHAVLAGQLVDAGFVERLAGSSGSDVTLLAGDGTGVSAVHSSIAPGARSGVAIAAGHSAAGGLPAVAARTDDGGRYVCRLPAEAGQPLPLAVSVPAARQHDLYAILAGIVLFVAAVTAVVARWLASSTTRPLADLAHATDRVAGGELATRVPIARDDELGRVARSFNRMTQRLQSYVQALTASRDQMRGHLAVLGDTLSSTHDLARILRLILQTAMSVAGARAGVVLLTDASGHQLVARCAEGLAGRWAVPESELSRLRVPLGHGVLGGVAAHGTARRGRGGDLSADSGEPGCRSYLAVPICAPTADVPAAMGNAASTASPQVFGVLALYDRLGADEFDDADELTLRTLAAQTGVAVHNVRVHEEAQRLSLTDPLTGLWNYRYLHESLRREVERASRFGRMLTVLVLDLDHFKSVNDTHGHAAGDQVLAEFARRVRSGLREVDLAFRQGGEEFVALLPETDAYGGVTVAERIGAAIRDVPVPISPNRVESDDGQDDGQPVEAIAISVSIGVAVYPDHGGSVQQVLAAADRALYAAKKAGRDTYRLAERGSADAGAGQFDQVPVAPAGPQPSRIRGGG